MSLSQIEMLRRRYDTAIREHAKAVKTGVNIEGTLVSAKAAGSQYMVAMTAHRIDDAVAPEDDFFSDPLKITQALRDMVRRYLVDVESDIPSDSERPMILTFHVGDSYSGQEPVPSPYDFSDRIYRDVVSIAPHCFLTEWSSECQEIYDFFDSLMPGGPEGPIGPV